MPHLNLLSCFKLISLLIVSLMMFASVQRLDKRLRTPESRSGTLRPRELSALAISNPSTPPTAISFCVTRSAKRVTLNSYNNPTPDSSTPGNHANAYWNVAPSGGYTTLTLNAIASKEIRATATGAVQARTEFSYDNPATTANLTVTRSWDSTKGAVTTPLTSGNSIATTNQYATYSNGATGKLVKTYDANNAAKRQWVGRERKPSQAGD